jgi:hypothetical protein
MTDIRQLLDMQFDTNNNGTVSRDMVQRMLHLRQLRDPQTMLRLAHMSRLRHRPPRPGGLPPPPGFAPEFRAPPRRPPPGFQPPSRFPPQPNTFDNDYPNGGSHQVRSAESKWMSTLGMMSQHRHLNPSSCPVLHVISS